MNVLLIAYDPSVEASAKASLDQIAKNQPGWARVLTNVFVTVTPLSASELRDTLIKASNSKLLVYNVTNLPWGTNKVDSEVTEWLKNNWQQ